MGEATILCQEVVDWAAHYDGPLFHGLLADAPYEINYRGDDWDRQGVAFRKDTWAAIGQHLYPGAIGMVFGASRLYHRLAVAIEDAGFIIHPNIFVYLQSESMPKPARVKPDPDGTWVDHRYGLQVLKSNVDPVVIFQKPYGKKERTRDGIQAYGTGTYNAEKSRVPGEKGRGIWGTNQGQSQSLYNDSLSNPDYRTEWHEEGRWPTNFISVHTQACRCLGKNAAGLLTWACVPDCPVQQLTAHHPQAKDYYFQAHWNYEAEERTYFGEPAFYCRKPRAKERNAGLDERNPHHTVKPIALIKYLAGMLLPPDRYAPRRLLVPFAGVGSEMVGAERAGWDLVYGVEWVDEFAQIAAKRLAYWRTQTAFAGDW